MTFLKTIDALVDELLAAFTFEGAYTGETRVQDGHINDTFVFHFRLPDGGKRSYLVQQLNTYVFRQPEALMENVLGVTAHLRKAVIARGGDPERECLSVYPARDGKPYYISEDGGFWRCYNYITDAHSCQTVDDPALFRRAAKAFGTFQELLADYPIDTLVETIPHFHDTASRFADFTRAVAEDRAGRAAEVQQEIDFIRAREADCSVLVDLIARGALPLRVTHNDTKLNNVMFDNQTGEGICVVDLDTVMPGLSLYDFGDSIRFGASTAAEDEPDTEKVHFSLPYFAAYTEGYLSACGRSLTANEIAYLPFSAKLMTLECGMRFLGDYLNGDVYFKCAYPTHNLVRARTQLKLVAEMEQAMPEMERAVADCCKAQGLA